MCYVLEYFPTYEGNIANLLFIIVTKYRYRTPE